VYHTDNHDLQHETVHIPCHEAMCVYVCVHKVCLKLVYPCVTSFVCLRDKHIIEQNRIVISCLSIYSLSQLYSYKNIWILKTNNNTLQECAPVRVDTFIKP